MTYVVTFTTRIMLSYEQFYAGGALGEDMVNNLEEFASWRYRLLNDRWMFRLLNDRWKI